MTAEGLPALPSPIRLSRRFDALFTIWLGVVPLALQTPVSGQDAAPVCVLPAAPGGDVGPEPWCAELVPVPAFRTARAVLELRPDRSPFGVAVTRDGRQRQQVIVTIEGLPDPDSLGAVEYAAWVADLALDDVARLGAVRNGRNVLGSVRRNQFRVLISAEPALSSSTRSGPIILRGTSPSVRLLAHRDVAAAGLPGQIVRPGEAGGHADHGDRGGWPMAPMDPAMAMMPGMMALRPAVSPMLPGTGIDPSALPAVQPRRVARLATGDTLRLEAGLVRKRVGAKTFVMYAFNRQQPGPLIQVAEDATIVVDFRNALDRPTSVHWHGVRLDNRFDGAAGVTQDAVEPGGRFVYHVRFPDAGIYWYHPHVREDSQQDLGLYGNMLVAAAQEDWLAPVHREEVITLDDFLVTENGPMPYGEEAPTHALMGRFGNVFLLNGEPAWATTATAGEVVRFWLTNVANTRIFNVSIGDARLKLAGADIGRYEREEFVESVVLAPAERAVIDVRFDRAGQYAITNRVQAVNHMLGTYTAQVDTLGIVTVRDGRVTEGPDSAFDVLRTNADVVAEFERVRRSLDRPIDREIELGMDTDRLSGALLSTMLLGYAPPFDWNDGMPGMNWLMSGNDLAWTIREPATGRTNMDIEWRFQAGDLVRIRIRNPSTAFHPMSHPIHIHGQRFAVVSRNGVANDNFVWKDTAVIGVGETIDILLELSNPGRWMLHCHIAEHLGAGMMMVMEVR
ncbi:MAG: multicopper oxidase family protein [Longimicrobiales bacterium]